jgi:hypothetical protein
MFPRIYVCRFFEKKLGRFTKSFPLFETTRIGHEFGIVFINGQGVVMDEGVIYK